MPDIEQQQIMEWLEDAGYSFELVEQSKVRFNIAFRHPPKEGGYVHAASAKPDRLSIIKGLSVTEEHQQALTDLGTDGFAAFRFALLRDLLRLADMTYSITGDASQNRMDGIQLQQDIPAEDLTRSSFFATVQRIYSTALLVVIHVRRAAGKMP